MHPDAFSYVATIKSTIPDPKRVVEFGSFDVNGSVRELFPDADWYGIDTRPGKGVDLVADVRDWDGGERYDLVVSTEMMEHCESPWRVIDAAYWALKPGGYLVATMAAPERDPHDGNGDPWRPECGEHYAGISRDELAGWLDAFSFETVSLVHDPAAGDLRCLARKILPGR